MANNIIWVGALGLGALMLTKQKTTTGPIVDQDTIPNIPTIEDPGSSEQSAIFGIAVNRNSIPNYSTWRGKQWAEYFKDVLINSDVDTASTLVWQKWSNGENPFRDRFPSLEAFILNLALRSAGSDNLPSINQVITVTADSQPIYNTWSNWWNNVEYWECPQWVMWYDKNALAYGSSAANDKFQNAWTYSDNWAWTSQTAGDNLVSVPSNLINAASQLTEGVVTTSNLAKTVLPPIIIIGGVYMAYKMIK
jgi:hypothetical protein